MKDSAQLFGAPSPDAAKFAIDMFNFEKRIAEITPDIEYMNNPVKVNNKMKESIYKLHSFLTLIIVISIVNPMFSFLKKVKLR